MEKALFVLWLIFFRLEMHIIRYHPISFFTLLLCLYDFLFLYVTLVFYLAESCINDTVYYYMQRKQCHKFIALFNRIDKNKLEHIDSEIVNKYKEAAIEIESNPILDDFPTNIHIYRLPSYYLKFFTFPIYYRESYIFVKSSFDESELIDRGLLAHELGHSFHNLYQNRKFLIPLNVFLLLLFLLFYSISIHDYLPLFFTFTVSLYILFIGLFRYDSDVETEADLRALKIVEKCEGKENMHSAAANLMRLRIQECRAQGPNPAFIHSILGLSSFIYPTDRYLFLKDSYKVYNKCRNNYINEEKQRHQKKFEHKLREIH